MRDGVWVGGREGSAGRGEGRMASDETEWWEDEGVTARGGGGGGSRTVGSVDGLNAIDMQIEG